MSAQMSWPAAAQRWQGCARSCATRSWSLCYTTIPVGNENNRAGAVLATLREELREELCEALPGMLGYSTITADHDFYRVVLCWRAALATLREELRDAELVTLAPGASYAQETSLARP